MTFVSCNIIIEKKKIFKRDLAALVNTYKLSKFKVRANFKGHANINWNGIINCNITGIYLIEKKNILNAYGSYTNALKKMYT